MQKRHRKGLLCCFATLAGVAVVGSSRVHVRYTPCRNRHRKGLLCCFATLAGVAVVGSSRVHVRYTPCRNRHRKGLLCCFATLAGVAVVGSSRVHVRYTPCRNRRRKGLLCCFATLAGITVVGSSRVHVRYNPCTRDTGKVCYVVFRHWRVLGRGVLPFTCEVESMQKRHRKGLLCCFATLAGVTVVGSSRVLVRYNPCRNRRRKGLLCCFATLAGVMVAGSSRVSVRYNPSTKYTGKNCAVLRHWRVLWSRGPPVYMFGRTHAEKTQERFVVLLCDTGGCYGHWVLPCTCEVEPMQKRHRKGLLGCFATLAGVTVVGSARVHVSEV